MDIIQTSVDTAQQHAVALNEALGLSSDGIIVYEALRDDNGSIYDYVVIALNDIATGIFGLEREQTVGRRITGLWPGMERLGMWQEGEKVVETRQPYTTEVQRITPAGDTRSFEVTLRPYGDGFANAYHDITAAKAAIQAVERQRNFYEDLLDHSGSRKSVLSPLRDAAGAIENFRYDYANYGEGIDDDYRRLPHIEVPVTGSLITDIFPYVKASGVWDFYCRLAGDGQPARTEIHYVQDGINTHMEVSGRRLADGRLLVDLVDIGEARRLATALGAERANLDALFQSVPLGVTSFEAVRDAGGTLLDLRLVRRNDKALQFSRIPVEKYVPGALLSDLMPAELSENLQRMMAVVHTGEPMLHELYQPHLGIWISSRIMKHGDGLLSTIQDITAIRQHSEEMRLQAELLEGVLEASPNAIAVFQAVRNAGGAITDFRSLHANSKMTGITGVERETYRRLNLFQRRPDLMSMLPLIGKVVNDREPYEGEYFVAETGRWVISSFTPLGDGYVSTIQDITEQKRITQRIEEGARLLNAVLDASPIAVVVYEAIRDAAGAIADFQPIIVNKQALQISGLDAAAFLSTSFFNRQSAGPKERLLPQLAAVVETQQAQRFEHAVSASGRWVVSITTPFGDGFISTAQDITEQKEQGRIIEEQATLFNGVLRSLQNGLSIFRIVRNEAGGLQDLVYVQVTDSVERDTGRTREAMIGRSIRELFPDIEQTAYWAAYEAMIRTGEPQHFETHFTLQGYDNYLLNWITPIGTDMMASVYYIINDLKLAQRELEHTVHELRRSNEDLEQFASIASHDLQEPLRKVQSFGAMLASRYATVLDDAGKDLLNRMQGAAGRMRNLVTGLLSFARLSGDEDLPLAPVDLHGLLAEIMADLDQTAESAGGTIAVPGRLPFVAGIDSQLRHLFHNLLTNALKFRKPGVAPVVSLTVSALQPGDASRLSPLAHAEQYIRLKVQDNGIGFEPQYAEKIFGLFERLHGLNEYQGTGLGLSICRRVAERHEGTIWAESHPGEGATFIVLLQRAQLG